MDETALLTIVKFLFVLACLVLAGLGGLLVLSARRKKKRDQKKGPMHLCRCCGEEGWWNKRIVGPDIVHLCPTCEASLSMKMFGLRVLNVHCTAHHKDLFILPNQG